MSKMYGPAELSARKNGKAKTCAAFWGCAHTGRERACKIIPVKTLPIARSVSRHTRVPSFCTCFKWTILIKTHDQGLLYQVSPRIRDLGDIGIIYHPWDLHQPLSILRYKAKRGDTFFAKFSFSDFRVLRYAHFAEQNPLFSWRLVTDECWVICTYSCRLNRRGSGDRLRKVDRSEIVH